MRRGGGWGKDLELLDEFDEYWTKDERFGSLVASQWPVLKKSRICRSMYRVYEREELCWSLKESLAGSTKKLCVSKFWVSERDEVRIFEHPIANT